MRIYLPRDLKAAEERAQQRRERPKSAAEVERETLAAASDTRASVPEHGAVIWDAEALDYLRRTETP